ncbi:hypothetical protein ACM9XA_01225 [Xanthomonas sacchari]
MSLTEVFRSANINRILIVDDDLSRVVDMTTLDQHGDGVVISQVLADPDHDYTVALDDVLDGMGRPHANAKERLEALKDPEIRAQAHVVLREAFDRAVQHRDDMHVPLDKVKGWLTANGVEIDEWPEVKDLSEADRYDLLVVDYFLMDNDPQATYELIRQFKQDHANREHPLLVILMSSDIDAIRGHFEEIRDKCKISASRFRILAKPVAANTDADEDVKEKWLRALRQLAAERGLVAPIERFVGAWEHSLKVAAEQMILRLYDLDASAFALLATTAKRDSMKIEEYLADVLSRRISAEAEEHSFPFKEIDALRLALNEAQGTIAPTIDQGVEVRHAQRAIRSLMSDVVWHRRPWWEPPGHPPKIDGPITTTNAVLATATAAPETGSTAPVEVAAAEGQGNVVLADGIAGQEAMSSNAGAAGADEAAATSPGPVEGEVPAPPPAAGTSLTRTADRLTWMKRYIRFGTVLRERGGAKRHFVNLTQACDIQSEKLSDVEDVHYLFVQGRKLPVDRVAVGEKKFDSPYYCDDLDSDEFFTLQWGLRQPFTPSMATLLDTLEDYEWVGQLRNDAAYAVLAKYVSQASRVAQIRMPKIYRYAVSVYHKQSTGWIKQQMASPREASAWQIDNKEWRLQFSVADARALLAYASGVADAKKPDLVSGLVRGLKVKTESGTPLSSKKVNDTTAILMRVDASADLDDVALLAQIEGHDKCKTAAVDDMLIVTRAMS